MSLGINCCEGQFLHPPPPQLPAVAQKSKDPQHAFSWSSICADADLRSIGAGPGRRRQKLIRPVSRSRRTRDEAAGLPNPRRGWEAGLRRAAAGAREGAVRRPRAARGGSGAALRPAGALARAASRGAGRTLAGKLHPTSCSHVSNAAHREGGRGRSANAAYAPQTLQGSKRRRHPTFPGWPGKLALEAALISWETSSSFAAGSGRPGRGLQGRGDGRAEGAAGPEGSLQAAVAADTRGFRSPPGTPG